MFYGLFTYHAKRNSNAFSIFGSLFGQFRHMFTYMNM